MRLAEVTWDYMRLHLFTCSHMGANEIGQGLRGFSIGQMRSQEVGWDHMRSTKVTWGPSRMVKVAGGRLRSREVLWGQLRSFEVLWDHWRSQEDSWEPEVTEGCWGPISKAKGIWGWSAEVPVPVPWVLLRFYEVIGDQKKVKLGRLRLVEWLANVVGCIFKVFP